MYVGGENEFGAFVMTYRRPETLIKTLEILLCQSFPPQFILVIDNNEGSEIKGALEEFQDARVEYYWTGKNIGPAGAAKIGLAEVAKRGYHWIYWGDDDNPPHNPHEFENIFERLPELEKYFPKLGIIGGKGGRMNRLTGRVKALSNKDLSESEYAKVDSVPGGHTLLVNADVIAQGILPSEELFFGFEELDFCIRTRKAGFDIVVFAEEWLKIRTAAGNTANKYRPRNSSFGKQELLWREYYSTRNLLAIYYRNAYYAAFSFWLAKSIIKSLAGYIHGFSYGRKYSACQWKAIADFSKIHIGKEGEGSSKK